MPIVADEARTFGMANLFKQIGIYSSVGQRYEPEDIGSILSYREATAGRTTLGGEGLQHQDGSSHLSAASVPNCRAYDPAFAVILDHGMRQMLEHDVDEFYYVTLMNENYPQPSLPDGVETAIIKGMYRLEGSSEAQVRLLGAGTLLREAQAAARLLADDW